MGSVCAMRREGRGVLSCPRCVASSCVYVQHLLFKWNTSESERNGGGGREKKNFAVPEIFQLCHDVGPIFPDKSWNRKQKENLKNSKRTDMEHLEAAGLATFPKSRGSFSLYLCFLLRILYTTTIRNSSSLLLSSFSCFSSWNDGQSHTLRRSGGVVSRYSILGRTKTISEEYSLLLPPSLSVALQETLEHVIRERERQVVTLQLHRFGPNL